jgi:MerR family copper efflux transcriptional regulator
MQIGKLAQSVGVTVQTVRYYERRGLLPEPDRTPSGYRSYNQEALRRLRFIVTAKGLGFTLSETKDLITLRVSPETTPEDVRDRARNKIQATKRKIASLRKLLAGLERVVSECEAGDSPLACALLHTLEQEGDGTPLETEP